MKVGFIGLGIMGRPMAKNMVKAAVAKSRWRNAAKAALAAINMSITRKARKKAARKNNHNQVNNNGRKENQNHCGKQKSQT